MAWHDIEQKAIEDGVSPRIVAMEAIQVQLLGAIYADHASASLGFQGGTCLRLVHGGHRYSEDLDFVSTLLTAAESNRLMSGAAGVAESRLAPVLGPGKGALDEPRSGRTGDVRTWWFRFQRHGSREVLRVKLELGRFPAHDLSPRAVLSPIPIGAPHALVMACSPRELLADKLNALAQRRYVKGRDLYDIWFLTETLGCTPDRELVEAKFRDYGTPDPHEALAKRKESLDATQLRLEMERFLPVSVRQHLGMRDYEPVVTAVRQVVEEVLG